LLTFQILSFGFPSGDAIAIVGMACRFPGGADSLESFWKLLHQGEDAIITVPSDRWDADAYYDADRSAPGKICSKLGGFLKEPIDGFDANFFGTEKKKV